MIAYIKGQLAFILDESIIVDVGGIGYEIVCPNPFIYQNSLQKELFIFTYHHVREDNQTLYGFKDEEEKYLFTKLISVSGIGPRSAVAILGNADVNEFITAIEQEDEKYLTKFPGVGKKTARQIILDLKGKLTAVFSMEETTTTVSPTSSAHISEAKEALKALGYTDKEINHVMSQLKKENITETDELIRKALALFVKN
ncbi:Holliday junction branch migration protein RuvA [Pseudogracilibacillus sp. ICA-222130]|uniref:Holliday junction branch migration protein RuvA n=1 Tax=Pseudogracilibacillus sp. ICA-222130 TaxID=3134655 RepID=UPI0030BA6D86